MLPQFWRVKNWLKFVFLLVPPFFFSRCSCQAVFSVSVWYHWVGDCWCGWCGEPFGQLWEGPFPLIECWIPEPQTRNRYLTCKKNEVIWAGCCSELEIMGVFAQILWDVWLRMGKNSCPCCCCCQCGCPVPRTRRTPALLFPSTGRKSYLSSLEAASMTLKYCGCKLLRNPYVL